MKKKLIVILIIILLIFIITCILGIIYLPQNESIDQVNIENTVSTENMIISEETYVEISEIQDIKKMYNIENIIRNYFEDVKGNESEPILKELNLENNDKMFYIKEAYTLELNEKNTLYFVKGNLINRDIFNINENNITKKEVILTITLDKENNTFDITKYGTKYGEAIKYKNSIKDNELIQETAKGINENIEVDVHNPFIEINVTDEQIARKLYEDYKINALYFPEDAYEKIDEEYKRERFKSFNSYKQYLQKYRTAIKESMISKYSVDNTGEYIEYNIVDTNQNAFVIKTRQNLMDYTILLDNYTIKSEGYEERYSNLDDKNKVLTNATIFMSMINTADYSHAYQLLDGTFKQNNFGTEQLFERYVDNKFFEYNIATIESVKKQGNYYICYLKVKNNNSRASEEKDLTIIMKLLEGTDFVMSFNIK